MTPQEAIEILRDTPIDIRSAREDDIHTLYATAQNMAIEALRNQISMKPIYADYDDDGYGNIIPFVADCPVCLHSFEFGKWNEEDNSYCRCGQKIDWEE